MNEREILLYNSLKGLHLLEKAPKDRVVRDLCGLQAQFARNPQYSLWLRATDYAPDTWDQGLVKIWSHRGTLHVVPGDEVGLHLSALGRLGEYEDGAWGMTSAQMNAWAPFLREQIESGNDTRDGLKAACRRAGMDEALLGRVFYGWGGLIREMCLRGQIVIKPGTEKAYQIPGRVHFMPRDQARRILIRRYFERFGPATRRDMAHFFTGYRSQDVKPLLEEILPALTETRIDGETYYHAHPLIQDGELPECVLAPGFDQLALGYKDKSRMIDENHARKLVNMAGIVFPSVIVRGKMRARWKIEGDAVCVTPFEHLLRRDEAAIRRAVRARLYPAIRHVRFLPEP